MHRLVLMFRAAVLVMAAAALTPSTVAANPFAPGWTLKSDVSAIRFQSVKNNSTVETSSFATFTGGIDADGRAEIKILLDSVDTKVDLRNVRMRFLFFETFQYPEAIVSLQIDPALIADLATVRRKVVTLPYEIDLHGVKKSQTAEVAITLLSDDLVSISSFEPVSLKVADFGLEGGVQKLQDAANVQIVPSSSVTFDFLFQRESGSEPVKVASAEPLTAPASAALEPTGAFSKEACEGRFEILSRTDNIYFRSGSAQLDARSRPLLNSIVDIVSRCPDLKIEVSGHTDSDGGAAINQRLSEARARSVSNYLIDSGVNGEKILTSGYGESRPVVPNDSAENKRRNRRIEFAVVGSS